MASEIQPREALTEADFDLFAQLSRGSWYYIQDLSRLWGFKTDKTRNAVQRLLRSKSLLMERLSPNHSRQGAPRQRYARADGFSQATADEYRKKAVTEEDDDEQSTEGGSNSEGSGGSSDVPNSDSSKEGEPTLPQSDS